MNYRQGFGILGLLITIAIIALLGSIAMKFYFGDATPAQEVEQGIDAIDAAQAAKDAADQKNREYQEALGH